MSEDDQDQQDLFDAAEADQQEQETRRWWEDETQVEAHNRLRAALKAETQRFHEEFNTWLRGRIY